jgi:hypothetical protein
LNTVECGRIDFQMLHAGADPLLRCSKSR